MSDWPFLRSFAERHRERPLALATLVAREGSSYRLPGARLLAAADGSHAGSISGGCLEDAVAEVGRGVLAGEPPRMLEIDTRPHFGCPGRLRLWVERLDPAEGLLEEIGRRLDQRRRFSLATVCGGPESGTRLLAEGAAAAEADWVERVDLQPRLVVVGWTSDIDPIFRCARPLAWRMLRVVREPRLLDGLAPLEGVETVVLEADEMAARLGSDERSAFVVMTHHLATDLRYLKALLPLPCAYLGLLGSRRRRETILAEAGECGLLDDPGLPERLFAPVGLDLGGDHPEAIGLAVVAEIQARLHRRPAGMLRDKAGAIHAPSPAQASPK